VTAGDERVPCPACGIDPAAWGEDHGGRAIGRCPSCGLRFLSPPPVGGARYDEAYFDTSRERYARPRWGTIEERDRASVEAIAPWVDLERADVLDVGTGTGSFLRFLKERGASGRLVGTDVTGANIEPLAAEGIEVRVGPLEEIEFDEPFDLVTAHHVLEHVPDPNAFLGKVLHALRSDGVFHLLVPNEGSAHSRWKSFLGRRGWSSRPFCHLATWHHRWFFEPATLTRLLEANGFEVVRLGTRAAPKRRGPLDRTLHRLLDRFRLNTWIEAVARPAGDA